MRVVNVKHLGDENVAEEHQEATAKEKRPE